MGDERLRKRDKSQSIPIERTEYGRAARGVFERVAAILADNDNEYSDRDHILSALQVSSEIGASLATPMMSACERRGAFICYTTEADVNRGYTAFWTLIGLICAVDKAEEEGLPQETVFEMQEILGEKAHLPGFQKSLHNSFLPVFFNECHNNLVTGDRLYDAGIAHAKADADILAYHLTPNLPELSVIG